MTQPQTEPREASASAIDLLANVVAVPSDGRPSRDRLTRRLTYIMLVRVLLYTLLLGGTVALHFAWGRPDELGGPYVSVLFVFIAVVYVLNIAFALTMRFFERMEKMAVLQIAVDLLTSAALIHFTGGANSAFILFFLLSPIAAPIVLGRRTAVIAATVSMLTLGAVVILGYTGALPTLPGQPYLPGDTTVTQMIRSLLVHGGAMIATGVLVGYLAEQANVQVREQQEQIGDLAQLNEDIIRCLASGLLTIDIDGGVLTLNEAAAELLDVDLEQAAGKTLRELAPELDGLAASAEIETQRPTSHEIKLLRNAETRIVSVSVSPLTDRLNRPVGRIIGMQDLTPLRLMEATARRAEHLAAIGRLAAGIAHEIRNPLASISGSLELLSSGEDLLPENRRLTGIALREIERLDGLIVDLLDFARPKPPMREPIDLGQAIHGLVNEIAGLMASETAPAINVVDSERAIWIKADRDQLRGVLWNLVRNAWQAGEQEQVSITARGRGAREVALSVRDHGDGISAKNQAHIFEPFFTTKAKGSGLGLAFVHRVVADHEGRLEVESEVGAGTTITIVLPRLAPPS